MSDATGAYRQTFWTSVFVNGSKLDTSVSRIQVEQRENEHESAAIFINSGSSGIDYTQLPNQRIEFSYGLIGNKATFRGYISEVIPHQSTGSAQIIQEQEIQCLGPSMVLKGNRPRFWDQSTATDAMRSIVSESGLGFSDEYHNDTYVWRSLAQTSETDWEMLVNLANMLACRLLVTDGVIRLVDYTQVATREIPSLTFTRDQALPMLRSEDGMPLTSLVSFVANNSGNRDPVYQSPQVSYLVNGRSTLTQPKTQSYLNADATAVQITNVLSSRFASDMPAASAQEADALLSGYYSPDWSETASVRVPGDCTLQPCMVIGIKSGGRYSPKIIDYDGGWYVTGATHFVYQNQYLIDLEVTRPSQRQPNWYQRTPFWSDDRRGAPRLFPIGTGQWVSTWR